jgi:hypothetical protein
MTQIGPKFFASSRYRLQRANRGRSSLIRFVFAHSGVCRRHWPLARSLPPAHGFGHGWGARMDDKPSREQFSIGQYQIQHIPTGAKFGAYPGESDLRYINWGRLGDLCSRSDYREELTRIARQLLRERKKF